MLSQNPQERVVRIASLVSGFCLVACFILKSFVPSEPEDLNLTADTIYPCLIRKEYLDYMQTETPGMVKPLGHEIYVGLVFDLDGLIRSATLDDLRRMKMTPEQAHAHALRNLESLARGRKISFNVLLDGPSGKPFLLVADHWNAATGILLPGLKDLVIGALATDDVFISIPHREAMLVFPKADPAHRHAMQALIKEKEADGSKPLTCELFTFDKAGLVPFVETN